MAYNNDTIAIKACLNRWPWHISFVKYLVLTSTGIYIDQHNVLWFTEWCISYCSTIWLKRNVFVVTISLIHFQSRCHNQAVFEAPMRSDDILTAPAIFFGLLLPSGRCRSPLLDAVFHLSSVSLSFFFLAQCIAGWFCKARWSSSNMTIRFQFLFLDCCQ